MVKRLFLCDLDGTLLANNEFANQQDIAILKKVQQNGHAVVLNSGRAWFRSQQYAKQLECDKYDNLVICNNGSYYSAVSNYEPKNLFLIKVENIYPFIQLLQKLKITFIFVSADYFNKLYVVNYNEQFCNIPKDIKFCHYIKDDLEFKHFFRNITMIYTSFDLDNNEQIKQMKIIDQEITKYNNFIVATKAINNNCANYDYMICSANSSKGIQAKIVAEKLNIDFKNVYVFGDGGNDIAAFEMFKSNSVAMENASQTVKNHAKYICKSNIKGGVGQFILEHKLDLKE